uniref:Uncharacterized protein n=1 Tax=Rhizophora mucronata TaxID=61149 RepID=A0A2P2Q110_RHIMU
MTDIKGPIVKYSLLQLFCKLRRQHVS